MTHDKFLYSENGKEDFEDEEEPLPRRRGEAPDGGWGWMIVFGACACNLVVDGLSTGFWVIQNSVEDYYGEQEHQSSIIMSLLAGFCLTAGPVASALCRRFGCRKVTIMGSILTCIICLVSPNMPSLKLLAVTYGFIGGMGLSFIFLPAIVTVSVWFEHKRAFATGLAMCGSGIGTLVFPPLYQHLLSDYDWKGATVIIAGIVLHCVASGALFRPLSYAKTTCMKRGIIQRGAIMNALIAEKARQRTISNGSLDNCIITKDNKLLKIDKIDLRNKSTSYINKLKESFGFSSRSLNRSKNSLIIPKVVVDPIYKPKASPKPLQSQSKAKSMSTPPTPKRDSGCGSLESPKTQSYNPLPTDDPWSKQSINKDGLLALASTSVQNVPTEEPSNKVVPDPQGTTSISVPVSPIGSRNSLNRQKMYIRSGSLPNGKPVMVPSELFSNSVMTVPPFTGSIQTIGFEEEEAKDCKLCRWLVRVFELRLLKQPTFIVLMVSSFLSMLGFYLPFMSLPAFGKERGLTSAVAMFLISIMAVTSLFGRLICGWIADRPWASAICVSNSTMVLSGVLSLLCPLFTSQSMLSAFAAGFGFFTAAFLCLRSVILVDLFGKEKLASTFGLYIMFQGLAVLLGNPITAVISNLGSSEAIFYMSGCFLIVAAIIGCSVKRVHLWEEDHYGSHHEMLEVVNIEEIPCIPETLKVETCESSI